MRIRRSGSGVYVLLSPRRYPNFVFGLDGKLKVIRTDAREELDIRITRARERGMARAPKIPDGDTAFRQVFWLRWRKRGQQGEAWLVGFRFLGHVAFEQVMRARYPEFAHDDLSGYDSQDSRFGGM